MNLFLPGDPKPVHFVGIAGAGMSALAQIALRRGVAVTGTDPLADGVGHLRGGGAVIERGPAPGMVELARAVVVSAAVAADHPEVSRAREVGIPILSRKEALAALVASGSTVAVAGTHGKTTTTVLTTLVLDAAGLRPTGIAGGFVEAWGGNALVGELPWFVVEADEYDQAFLSLSPTVAVITNVDVDHLECYGTEDALDDAFVKFACSAEHILVGTAGSRVDHIRPRLGSRSISFGPGEALGWSEARFTDRGTEALLVFPDGASCTIRLMLPGEHNLRNAVAAMGVAWCLGADLEQAARPLEDFRGVGRRFEVLGTFGGVTIIDDYAHHPSEISAVLAGARQRFPGRRIIAVFQPHLYSRTQRFGESMGRALAQAADLSFVTAIYPAREQAIPGVHGGLVSQAVLEAGGEGRYEADHGRLLEAVQGAVRAGDIVLTLGAGDISEWGRRLAAHLAEDSCLA